MTADKRRGDAGSALLLTAERVCELLGQSHSSISVLVRGKLPVVHSRGRSARVPCAAIKAFVDALAAEVV